MAVSCSLAVRTVVGENILEVSFSCPHDGGGTHVGVFVSCPHGDRGT